MLAIITKMTLTQVSTWFANARRRLKKENKMQWSPRNRTGDDDDGKSDDENDDNDVDNDNNNKDKNSNLNNNKDDLDLSGDSGFNTSSHNAGLLENGLHGKDDSLFPRRLGDDDDDDIVVDGGKCGVFFFNFGQNKK